MQSASVDNSILCIQFYVYKNQKTKCGIVAWSQSSIQNGNL